MSPVGGSELPEVLFDPNFSMVKILARDKIVTHRQESPDDPIGDVSDRYLLGGPTQANPIDTPFGDNPLLDVLALTIQKALSNPWQHALPLRCHDGEDPIEAILKLASNSTSATPIHPTLPHSTVAQLEVKADEKFEKEDVDEEWYTIQKQRVMAR